MSTCDLEWNTNLPSSIVKVKWGQIIFYTCGASSFALGYVPWLSSPNNVVTAIREQPDGKVLIWGAFTTVWGITRNRIARLNTDKSLDLTFNPNLNNSVNDIKLQDDGKILIWGTFTTIWGVTGNRIARLNTDDTLDTSFNPNANTTVNDIEIQSDGKILIGGAFTTIWGVIRHRIARLNTDGSLDTSFDPNANSIVNRIYILPNGDMIIWWQFTTVWAISGTRLAKIDTNGTIDTTFNPNINNTVFAITQDQYNNVYFGWAFTTVNWNANNAYLAMIWTNEVVNNIKLWLKADSLTSLEDWDSVSRRKNFWSRSDATQFTTTNKPILKLKTVDNLVDNINFNPIVQFNGTGNFMVVSGWLLSSDTLWDAYIYVISSSTPTNQYLFHEDDGSPYPCPRFSLSIPQADSNIYRDAWDCWSDSRLFTNRWWVSNKPYLWSLWKSTTNTPQNVKQDIRRNGLTIATSTTTNPMVWNSSDLFLWSSPTASFFSWNIAEMIIYMWSGWIINKTQQNKIESYLSIKYGMTLDQSAGWQNYILNNWLVSWSTGSVWIYDKDIAWIVRDDASWLAQTKSQSINNTWDIIIDKWVSLNNNTSLVWANNNWTIWARTTTELATWLISKVRIAREWKLQQKKWKRRFSYCDISITEYFITGWSGIYAYWFGWWFFQWWKSRNNWFTRLMILDIYYFI